MRHKPNRVLSIVQVVVAAILVVSASASFGGQREGKKLLHSRMSIQSMDLKRDISREDLISAGQLGGHLFPTKAQEKRGDKRAGNERKRMRREFGEAIQNWNRHDYKHAYHQFKTYAEKYPASPWAGEAKLHMACEARYNGRYTEAEATFNELIEQYGKDDYDGSRMLADKAKSRLAVLNILENNRPQAIRQFADLKANAQDWRLRTYASNWIQRIGRKNASDVSLLDCGTRALAHLLKQQGKIKASQEVLKIEPGDKGQSLSELRRIATKYGMAVTGLALNVEQLKSVPLPAIVQIDPRSEGGVGHYWIVEKIVKDEITLFDPQMPRRHKQTPEEFEREWSGNALVFSAAEGLTGRVLAKAEMDNIFGGCCGVQRPESGLGDPGGSERRPCDKGAPVWAVNPINMNFYMTDTPLWYTPAYGPELVIKLSYNSQSAIAQHEPFGNKWSFNYGSYLLVDPAETVTVFMPDGRRDVYTPDAEGGYSAPFGVQNKLVKLAENHFLLQFLNGREYEYAIPEGTDSMQPFLVRLTDGDGNSLTFGYDENIHLSRITDATGQITQLTYNAEGLVTQVTDPFGRSASFEYDSDLNLTRLTDMGGYWTAIGYDQDVYVASVSNPLGEWKFYTEPADGESNGIVPYPPPGGPITMWENYRITITNPEGGKEEYYYNGDEGVGWYVSPRHYVDYLDADTNNWSMAPKTKFYPFEFNGVGRISFVTYPEGGGREYTYDNSNGLIATERDFASNNVIQYAYNAHGEPTQVTLPGGQTTTFGYDTNGIDLTRITTALGSVEITYDEHRRPITLKNIAGKLSHVSYNAYGQIATATNALQQVTRYGYNANQRLETVSLDDQLLTQYSYDTKGRLASETDATGLTVTYSYNDLDSLTQVSYPDGGTSSYSYATCPRLMQQSVQRGGRTTAYSYDKMQRRVADTNSGNNWTNRYLYDADGNLIEFIDPDNNHTHFSYDKNDRLQSKSYADGQGLSYQYNTHGLLSTVTNARGIETHYTYNSNDELLSVSYSDGTPGVSYSYDAHDRLTGIQDGVGTTAITYNTDSSIATLDGPWDADTLSYSYDDGGRLTSLSVEGGPQRVYHYDSLNRLSEIEVGTRHFVYQYQGNSSVAESLTLPNHSLTEYGYDSMNRLQQLTNRTEAGDLLSQYGFSYNSRDLITTESRTGTLAFIGSEAQHRFENNVLNQTMQLDGQPFQYDADGNLTQGYTPAGYLFSASYDAENRLVELSYTDSDGLLHSKLYAYTWNDLLAQIQSYENGALVDDLRIVRAGFLPLQDRDGNNAVVRDYLWGRNGGGGIGGLLSMRTGGEDYYYHYDGRGNVTSVTDSAQQKVAEYTYTDYGNINNQSGSLSQPFRFSTKRLDEETGLIYFGYRYYVPGSRKWLTRDPIEEAGGVNLYGYVHGNPINYTDPTGELALIGGLIGAGGNLAYQLWKNGGNLDCVNWWQVGAWGLTGSGVGIVGRAGLTGVANFFSNANKFRNISRAYWGARGGANGMSLDHWMISQAAGRSGAVSERIVNGGWNLLEMPASWNTWLGFAPNWGGTQAAMANAARLGIQLGVPGIAAASGYAGYQIGTNAQQEKCGCQ